MMSRANHFLCFIICLFSHLAFAEQTGKWGDQGDGTFRNPVIAADFSDPDPVRVGDDYYMVSSTFESVPGVTVLHSRDLVNWEIIGGVFTNLEKISPAFGWKEMNRYDAGVYAPSIRYHDGKFWVFDNFYTDGFFVATAKNPAGPWDVRQIKDKNGKPLSTMHWTDPCPFWDDDGKAYLASSRPPGNHWYGYLFQMTPDGSQLLDADVDYMNQNDIIYQFPNGGTLISPNHSSEGNKIYKRDGYYYLIHIEFLGQQAGTWVYRSKNIYGTKKDGTPGKPGDPGEYEKRRFDPPASETGGKYQQVLPGQGGLVDTPDGRWFYIAQFNRYGSDGRTPCLVPVTWTNDWPVVGVGPIENGYGKMAWQLPKPIASTNIFLPQRSDDFNSPTLAPFWAWNHQPRADKWSLTERPGCLRLHASATADGTDNFFKISNVINQRQMRSDSLTITAKLDLSGMVAGQKGGLANFNGGKNYSSLAVAIGDDGSRKLVCEINGKATDGPTLPDNQNTIYLRSNCTFDDKQTYQYSYDGQSYQDVGGVYHPTTANFRGNMIGLFTYNNAKETGYLDVDSFQYDVKNK